MNIWQWLEELICLIGRAPLCNRIPERAPHIFGYCFVLCYRCTFIFLGFLITLFIIRNITNITITKAWVLLLPMIIDGGIQTFMGVESTNLRRIITGTIFGIGMAVFVKWGWQKVDQKLLINKQKDSIIP